MLAGYKTYITVGLAVLTALAGYLDGDLTPLAAMTAAFSALSVAFLRNGIKTGA